MLRIWVFDLKSEVISTPLVDGPVNHFSSSQQSARINGKRCGPTPSEDRERPFPKKKQGFQFNKDSGSLKRVLDMISGSDVQARARSPKPARAGPRKPSQA